MEVDGDPPGKDHNHEVGSLMDRSLNWTDSPATIVVLTAVKTAVGSVAQPAHKNVIITTKTNGRI